MTMIMEMLPNKEEIGRVGDDNHDDNDGKW